MEHPTERAVGVHRVVEPLGVLPQAAWRLDAAALIGPDEVRVRVSRLNLDAASLHQLRDKHVGDGRRVRDEVAGIIASRGKMHNPVTGSGGMLIGVVEEVGAESPLGLAVGDRIATLVSLTLTPLQIHDGHFGAGYGQATDDDLRFYVDFATKEGLVLDPCYTGKAMGGMLAEIKQDPSRFGEHVLFLHSGGVYENFAYADQYRRALDGG